jgi:uncharacterized tellurite resistance protein B-like protein
MNNWENLSEADRKRLLEAGIGEQQISEVLGKLSNSFDQFGELINRFFQQAAETIEQLPPEERQQFLSEMANVAADD